MTKILLLSDRLSETETLEKAIRDELIEFHTHALSRINSISYDEYSLVILNLCGITGKTRDYLYNIRLSSNIPIFIISNIESEEVRAQYYDHGADGYIPFPISVIEAVSQIKTFIRRFGIHCTPVIINEDNSPLSLNSSDKTITYRGKTVQLTNVEHHIMTFFAHHANQIIPRDTFKENARLQGYSHNANTLNIHISRIRTKCGFDTRYPIETINGIGYRLNVRPLSFP